MQMTDSYKILNLATIFDELCVKILCANPGQI